MINMPKLTREEKWEELKRLAFLQGRKILPDKRLSDTPYAAMNPTAGKVLKQPYIKGAYTYDPELGKKRRVKDITHEAVEEPLMINGHTYHYAHKVANRKQNSLTYLLENI